VKITDQALQEALDDAKLKPDHRVGLVLGTSLADTTVFEKQFKDLIEKKDVTLNHSRLITGTMGYLAAHIQRKFKVSGPSYVISNTCVSGISAIGIGCHLINSGQVDYCIVGSVEIVGDLIYYGMKSLNALSASNKLKPFAAGRDGMVLGEGAGFLVLTNQKPKTSYGKILGYAITNDGTHLTAPDREGRGLIKAMERSMAMAEIKANVLDCIFCGGTGTNYNDAMQALAIQYIERKSETPIPVTSIKPLIGHTLGASGVIESIAALIMMKEGWLIPPGSNYIVEPELEPIPLLKKTYYGAIENSLLISSGFTGVNGALILRREGN
jgi:3-oxoacyl-[acyl-carrier-protein] synthase II